MRGIAALFLLGLVASGCSHEARALTGPSFPAAGQYYDCNNGTQGPWLSLATNTVVNVACPQMIVMPYMTSGPCAGMTERPERFIASYRGALVSADSAAGVLLYVYPEIPDSVFAPDVTVTGTFTAKWENGTWHVVAGVTASDGCRTTHPPELLFDACP